MLKKKKLYNTSNKQKIKPQKKMQNKTGNSERKFSLKLIGVAHQFFFLKPNSIVQQCI